ncbi:MAG: GNAT family N-acetyltransferase [Steroidobacteraceae bacterium]
MNITIRRGKPEDAKMGCGSICYDAFVTISRTHNFPPDFPSPEIAGNLLEWMLSHPRFYCVVAQSGDRIVGSNVLDERNPIYGIGPITVDPGAQNASVGRLLMEDVMARVAAQGAPGVRLVQAAFHNRSLALYTKLGFDVREPLVCMQGASVAVKLPGRRVRPAVEADLDACNRVCCAVHGHDRGGELLDAIRQGTATVVEYGDRIAGYATIVGFFGHAVGESNADLQALIGDAKGIAGSGFLLPSRNAELFRWCLAHGLRVIQPLTLMSLGLYNDPAGAFLPSITY